MNGQFRKDYSMNDDLIWNLRSWKKWNMFMLPTFLTKFVLSATRVFYIQLSIYNDTIVQLLTYCTLKSAQNSNIYYLQPFFLMTTKQLWSPWMLIQRYGLSRTLILQNKLFICLFAFFVSMKALWKWWKMLLISS